ncbi:LysR family transcriptional regulator [Dyella sp.]|jgi:DNA-binding transcriptional LysR family regulator|uniref:LysR family transcriptional regulator n=1 Tax=Dyella sp. TaxID=1869338 RepID=UPI002D773FC8|nr:LysR family transcriptional regulator [Dyella sp.]HET6432616.1 LysR family transcriptional regulator [Dyella sp.]
MTERDLPPLNALRAFEATARLESVTRAAQELHVTHGAVSRQLRLLEDALGRPLFARQGRGLALTDAGAQLRDAAGTALEQLRDSWAGLRRSTRAPFVLGCSGSLLARWVIPRLHRLNRDLPDLPLHLSAQEDAPGAELDGLDGALLLAAPPWPSAWRVDTLATERIGPVLSPRYAGWPRLQGQPISALLDEPVLQTRSRPQAWRDWSDAAGLAGPPHATGQEFAHLYYLLEAALAGLGVAIAPAPLVAEDLASGRLIAPWGFCETASSWVLATPQRAGDGRALALAHWLQAELAGG